MVQSESEEGESGSEEEDGEQSGSESGSESEPGALRTAGRPLGDIWQHEGLGAGKGGTSLLGGRGAACTASKVTVQWKRRNAA